MSKFKEKFTNYLLIIAQKMNTERHMIAIKNGFSALLPVVIAGSVCILFANVICASETTGISLAKIPGMSWLSFFEPMFKAGYYATLNFFTIAAVIVIAIELAKQMKHDELSVPLIAVSSFITLCNTDVLVNVEGVSKAITVSNVLSKDYTSATGLFVGLIVTMVSVELYVRLTDCGKLNIKMPEGVPSSVATSFNVLIPGILTILIVSLFGLLFQTFVGMTFFDAVSQFVQAPFQGILTGLPGYLILFVFIQLFWFFGIHGTAALTPVFKPILLAAILENTEAVANNKVPPHILNESFGTCFTLLGGGGCTLALVIAILICSKREDYKAVAKISLIPGIFNINETCIFGLPVVLNPILLIPFVAAPLIVTTFAYIMTKIGFCGVMVYSLPWTTPPLIGAWLGSGGDIGAVITQGLCLVIATLVYIPFVSMANHKRDSEI